MITRVYFVVYQKNDDGIIQLGSITVLTKGWLAKHNDAFKFAAYYLRKKYGDTVITDFKRI